MSPERPVQFVEFLLAISRLTILARMLRTRSRRMVRREWPAGIELGADFGLDFG